MTVELLVIIPLAAVLFAVLAVALDDDEDTYD